MGSKLSPGAFDCYAKALPDEPMFVLLARDPQAPAAVAAWATHVRRSIEAGDRPAEDMAMVDEALICGLGMIDWRARNDGAWRKPLPGAATGPAGHGRIVESYAGGWTLLERDGHRYRQYLMRGARMGALGPHPFDPAQMVISIESGLAPAPGREDDAVLFSLTAEGLEALAARLLSAASSLRAGGAPIALRPAL